MFNFLKKIKSKKEPLHCDFCGAKISRQPLTAEVKTPPYLLHFCCYGCKIGYLTLGKSESSILDFIKHDPVLSGQMPVFEKEPVRSGLYPRNTGAEEGGEKDITFGIKGVTCSSCLPVIEKTLGYLDGISSAKVNPVTHSVTLRAGSTGFDMKAVKTVLKRLGYGISEYDNSYDTVKEESYSLLARFGFGIFMSMNIMIFSILLYSRYFAKLRTQIVNYSHFILWAFTTVIIIVVGFPIFKSAFKKLLAFTYNSDTLISLGVLSAYIYSSFITFNLYKESSGVFFDTAAMILILVTFGKFLEATAKRSSLSGLNNLINLRPNLATLFNDGKEKEVDAGDVKKGDVLIVRSEGLIPADGVLVSDAAVIDESMYNGEPLPVNKNRNDGLISGSINKGGDIKMAASTDVYGSYLFKMLRFVERAYNMKIEPLRYIDKISLVFVPVIMGIAVFTFGLYFLFTGSLDISLIRFISVLVVACPCAFGLAAPLVITGGISKAQKDKILINGAETLELLSKADTFIFDKTGTLTHGLPEIKDVVTVGSERRAEGFSLNDLIEISCFVENSVNDRIAESFRKKAAELKIENNGKIVEKDISDIEFTPGRGIGAKYLNSKVLLGNVQFLDANGVKIDTSVKDEALRFEKMGATVVYMSVEKNLKCFFVIRDEIKENASEAVKDLISRNKRVIMLSGDNEEAVKFTASKIGIPAADAYYSMNPEEKLKFVQKLKEGERDSVIAFVGDGLNDVPAMEAADISVLSPSRYELPFNRSNVVILDGDMRSIAILIKLSMDVKRIIKENLLFSFIYNFAAVPLAVIGMLNPLSAAVSMIVSSIFITFNSLRIKFKSSFKFRRKALAPEGAILNPNTLLLNKDN